MNKEENPYSEEILYQYPKPTQEEVDEFQNRVEDEYDEDYSYFDEMFRNCPPYGYIEHHSQVLDKTIMFYIWHNYSNCYPRYAVMIYLKYEPNKKILGDVVKIPKDQHK